MKNEKYENMKNETYEKNTAEQYIPNCLNNDRSPMHTVRKSDPDAISTIFL